MKWLLSYKKPPVANQYIYLVAFLFWVVVVINSTINIDSGFKIDLNHIVIITITYFLWALMLPFIYGNIDLFKNNKSFQQGIFVLVIQSILIIIVHVIFSNFLYYCYLMVASTITVSNALNQMQTFFAQIMVSRLIDYILIFSALQLISNYREYHRQKIAVAELKNQLAYTEMEVLKSQLNPHFLFNALHAVHSLIGYDDEKARAMLIKISSLLRKILNQKNNHFFTLKEELAYLKDYLDIEQERFHDRLSIEYDIDDRLLESEVPSLLFQVLAENAFKHGISLLEGGGKVKIIIHQDDDQRIVLGMLNSVPENSIKAPHSFGIGLTNLQKRLEKIYGNNYTLKTDVNNGFFKILILIPDKPIQKL
ncbi:sensor histidine kinase [Leptobacterium sp. I13]|uniref:sensor histidine kinase n=1 Tax=Leptobacterium meishanense TaxID=3128904 RepID=UPI0030EE8568